MKKFSCSTTIIFAVFSSLCVFFSASIEGKKMPNGKKRITYLALEEHVLAWSKDQVENIKSVLDMLEDNEDISNDQRDRIHIGISETMRELLELLKPICNDDREMIKWMKDFIKKHPID